MLSALTTAQEWDKADWVGRKGELCAVYPIGSSEIGTDIQSCPESR